MEVSFSGMDDRSEGECPLCLYSACERARIVLIIIISDDKLTFIEYLFNSWFFKIKFPLVILMIIMIKMNMYGISTVSKVLS